MRATGSFLGTFGAHERWISLNAGPAGARACAEPKRSQRGRSSRRRGIALIAVDTILDVSIKCLQKGRFPMDEVEIPTISGESDLEAALKRMEKEDKSALVVDFREGPRLLFADELLPVLRERGGKLPIRDVPPSARAVRVPIPGGSITIPAPPGVRRGLDASFSSSGAQYAVVGIRGDQARVVSATGDLSRLRSPFPKNV